VFGPITEAAEIWRINQSGFASQDASPVASEIVEYLPFARKFTMSAEERQQLFPIFKPYF
jgi:hypothetical protein